MRNINSSYGFLQYVYGASLSNKSYISELIKLILFIIIFIVVLFFAYYITKVISNYSVNNNKNSNMKIIEVISVSQGKTLQLIKVGKTVILIAVTKDKVEFITEIDREEISYKKTNEESIGFKEQLNKYADILKKKR